jgi:hypothetical protein
MSFCVLPAESYPISSKCSVGVGVFQFLYINLLRKFSIQIKINNDKSPPPRKKIKLSKLETVAFLKKRGTEFKADKEYKKAEWWHKFKFLCIDGVVHQEWAICKMCNSVLNGESTNGTS